MNKLFREYLNDFAAVYIDDIMIYSKTFEEHLHHIELILKKLREANVMLKLKKCKWGDRNVEYLGHIVGRGGLKPDPKKIDKIKDLKPPKDVTGVRSILGICSYYRKFIKGFSKIAKPLNDLLKKEIKFEWTEKQQEAFDKLKQKLIEHPILEYPNYEKPFTLITDASGRGLGAVLAQKNDQGKEVVITYASKSLSPAEKNYAITEQECLAVIFGIKHFHKYLIDRSFIIITDHSALKGFLNDKRPKGRRARWLMEVQQYNFTIQHRPGKENKNADFLSRI